MLKLSQNTNAKMELPSINTLTKDLKKTVYELCLPGGRVVGTAGHKIAEDYLRDRLAEAGCLPYAGDAFDLPYSREGHHFLNFAGVIPGRDRSLAPILIGAHYDSVIPHPCADDNGAAVAICLAVAAAAATGAALERDLVIAIFDAEEPPYFSSSFMGSVRFYEDQVDRRGIHFAMIHDLVGHDISIALNFIPGVGMIAGLGDKDMAVPFLKNGVFVTGAESNPDLSRIIEQNDVSGLKVAATLNRYVGDMSDHGIFRKNGIPYLFFSCGRWAHYHMPSDTPDRLNYRKMAHIAELSSRILEQVAGEPLPDYSEADHTLDYEIRSFKNLVGPFYPVLMKKLGVKELKTRKNVEDVVSTLLNLGL